MKLPDCVFCGIAARKIPASIVFEDKNVIAFDDINPRAPVHVVITPKNHETNYVTPLGIAARQTAHKKGVEKSGYRLIINQGKDARQEIEHLHMHLLGGKDLGPMI